MPENDGSSPEFLTLEEASEFLRCSARFLRAEVTTTGEIPHIPFAGRMLFYKPHLREYLLSKERGNERQERCQSTTATEDLQTPLVLQVIEASQLKPRPAKQYVNLCDPESGLVYAQIHPNSRAGDLVIPEPDQELPECQHLERVETEDFESLAGYYGPNRDWMLGNGKRFTTKPAAVFHIPPAAQTDPNHGAWREIQALIKYAKNRRERRRST